MLAMSVFNSILLALVNVPYCHHIHMAVKQGVNLICKASVNIKWNTGKAAVMSSCLQSSLVNRVWTSLSFNFFYCLNKIMEPSQYFM